MRTSSSARRAKTTVHALAVLLMAAAPCPTALAENDVEEGPPGLPPGTLTLHVAPTSAEFRPAPGLPNTWQAGPFEVEASCPLRIWAVLVEVSALTHHRERHHIPPERVQFVPLADAGGGGPGR